MGGGLYNIYQTEIFDEIWKYGRKMKRGNDKEESIPREEKRGKRSLFILNTTTNCFVIDLGRYGLFGVRMGNRFWVL